MDIIKIAKEAFHFDPVSGVFTWKRRPIHHFPDERAMKIFNTRYSGKVAGSTKKNKNGKSYCYVRLMDKDYMAHRIAWGIHYGKMPSSQIDHIDGCGTNNSISNLRDVSGHDNHKNMRLFRNNKNGIPGVYKHNQANVWVVRIQVDRKHIHIGCYKSFFDACCARKSAEIKYGFHRNHGSDRDL